MTGETDLVARQGVEAVRLLLLTELGWYPREPVDPDYGVDVYVESAVDGVPDGRMLALQIKSGSSYFTERTDTHITYRGSDRHLRYWSGHSLPVVLVLYHPEERVAYWQAITPETVQDTGKNWKVDVPVSQRVHAASAEALRDLADGDPYLLYLNALRADRSWMQLLAGGGTVFLEVDEWVNKTSGRGEFLIIGTPAGEGEPLERTRTGYFGLWPYAEVLPRLFAWAHLAVDEDLYDMHEEDQWNLDCGAYDSEACTYIIHTESFSDWRASKPDLRPYESAGGGEVDRWRLELTLNDVGRSFLTLDGYIAAQLAPTPSVVEDDGTAET